MRFPALLLLCCCVLGAQTAGFGGMAVNSVTGQPLAGVHLKLFTLNVGGAIPDVYGAMSGRDGRFSVTGLPPGTYLLFTERTGFVHMMTAAGAIPLPSVTLRAGDRITDYRLEMTPRAVIAGRVVDEYGDPVPNVMVEASATRPGAPAAASVNSGNRRTVTNNRGEFRLSGGPGQFYVKATPDRSSQAQEIRSDGSSDAVYGPAWYPAATVVDRASAVVAEAGADVTGIEIRLTSQRAITISGTVSGVPQGSSAAINLLWGDAPDRYNMGRGITAGPDGKFTASRLAPAFYRISASAGSLRSQAVYLNPDSPDVVDVPLALTAGAEVTGTLEIAGDPPGMPVEKRTVTLGSANAATEPDGSFKIAGVFPERYQVGVRPLPENGYIKAVELDGVAVSGLDVDCSRCAQGSRLKITLARDGAQLSGTVLDKDGQPLGTTIAIVVLASDRDHIAPNQDGQVKPGGKYSLTGIRPGKYLLFAVDAFRSGPLNSDADLKKLAVAAEEIEIKAGDKIAKDIKVLLREDADAPAKK